MSSTMPHSSQTNCATIRAMSISSNYRNWDDLNYSNIHIHMYLKILLTCHHGYQCSKLFIMATFRAGLASGSPSIFFISVFSVLAILWVRKFPSFYASSYAFVRTLAMITSDFLFFVFPGLAYPSNTADSLYR